MEAGRRTKDEKQGTKLGRQLAMGPKCEFFEFQSGFFWEQRKKNLNTNTNLNIFRF